MESLYNIYDEYKISENKKTFAFIFFIAFFSCVFFSFLAFFAGNDFSFLNFVSVILSSGSFILSIIGFLGLCDDGGLRYIKNFKKEYLLHTQVVKKFEQTFNEEKTNLLDFFNKTKNLNFLTQKETKSIDKIISFFNENKSNIEIMSMIEKNEDLFESIEQRQKLLESSKIKGTPLNIDDLEKLF